MKRTLLLSTLLSFWTSLAFAQAVAINTDNSAPDSSAILDVKSTDKGILVPRMTNAQRLAIPSPATGLMVYDIDMQSFCFHGGADWVNVLTNDSGWSLSGNSASGSDFIGTTNNQSLLFKANNLQAGKIDLALSNSFWGSGAGASITTGDHNTAIGKNALYSNTTGYYNTAQGAAALYSNTTGVFNTADGADALYFNTTGSFNTANGDEALYHNTTGESNTANGRSALSSNTIGFHNTANGRNALFFNTTGTQNTANGSSALYSNTTGSYNTANGLSALYSNTTGNSNTANGAFALRYNTTGQLNTATGVNTLLSNTTGVNNTATGHDALYSNSYGGNNTANGVNALRSNSIGHQNTGIGLDALYSNYSGTNNSANGVFALYSNTTGNENTANGGMALYSNTTATGNVANGMEALYSNTTGNYNTANGWHALYTNTTGSSNTAIGHLADVTMNNLTNATAIGYNAKAGASNSLVLGGTGADAVKVGIGTQTPSTTLEVIGQVKITGGSPGVDKVLTSDANGLATWQTPAPPAATEIAYVYNLTATTIAIEDDIPFDSNGSITSGFTHTAGSTDIVVVDAGTYAVRFSVSGTEPNQFGLFLNGSVVPGSIYGSGAGTQPNNGQAIFSISAGDVLTLRNHTSAAAVGLASMMGGTQANVNASISIEKL